MAMQTPSLPPVSPNVDQSDAYEKMYKAFKNGDVAAFATEQCEEAQGTRDDVGGTLTGEGLDYRIPGYGIAGDADRTPSETEQMKVQPHVSLSGAKAQESLVVE